MLSWKNSNHRMMILLCLIGVIIYSLVEVHRSIFQIVIFSRIQQKEENIKALTSMSNDTIKRKDPDTQNDSTSELFPKKISQNTTRKKTEQTNLEIKNNEHSSVLIHHKLKSPYRIYQIGKSRSGSSFQFELLCSIVLWKSPSNMTVHCESIAKSAQLNPGFGQTIKNKMMNNSESFVWKSHPVRLHDAIYLRSLLMEMRDDITVFQSSGELNESVNNIIYTQTRKDLETCPSCEVQKYQDFFHLTQEEMNMLQTHMKMYGILRKCCGLQMSKHEMNRLHGCNSTVSLNDSAYPHCERHNLSNIELIFHLSPIPRIPEYNREKPGDCKRFRDKILSENLGFNGKIFKGCTS